MRASPSLLGIGFLGFVALSCGGDTLCQSGAKYGTQCYVASDVRTPPGQHPPSAAEPPAWWQPTPPPKFGSSGSGGTTGGTVPMSSPSWRPSGMITDAGTD